jgi:transposase
VLSLTILLEIDAVERFDTRQQFCSYARLCGAVQESAGKKVGVGCRKQGNAWLKWAFSEAAVLGAQKDERIGAYLQRLTARHGTGKALGVLSHKLGRAMYHMLRTKRVFDIDKFLRH